MKDDLEFLKANRIFSGLFAQDIDSLFNLLTLGSTKRNEYVFQIGDPPDFVYWVKTGRAKIIKLTEDGREMIYGICNPGDIFGEMAFVENTPRDTTVVAEEDMAWFAIKRNHLFALAKSKPGIIYRFAQLIGERRREAEEMTEVLLYRGVRERLVSMLLRLSKEYGIQDARGKLLRIKITHQDLASMIGSSRETVSLTMGDLKREGVIEVNERKIIIKNEEQLAPRS